MSILMRFRSVITYSSNKFIYWIPLSILALQVACVSTKAPVSTKNRELQQPKTSTQKSQPIAKPGQKTVEQEQHQSQQENLREQAFIQALNTSYEILGSDLQKVKQRQPLTPRSLDEAYAVVVLLRFATGEQGRSDFKTKDLNQAESPSLPQETSAAAQNFRDLFKSFGVELDLMRALRTNPFVQSTRIYQLAVEAAQKLPPTSPDRLSLLQLLQGKQQRFQSLLTSQGFSGGNNQTANEAPSQSELRPEKASRRNSPQEISIADLRHGDSILRQATQMAARGEYKDAIDLAAKIETQDPYFATAQEKIKEFSNMAVQSLRQKAAQAFQSSLPVSDKETKAAYLLEAQGYLKEAIDNYPKADQLNTVRENLEVISQDLEGITEESNERG